MDRSQPIDLVYNIVDGRNISQYQDNFLPGHLDRLSRRLENVSKRNIKHYKVNSLNVFIVMDNTKFYQDAMMLALNNLKVVFDEVEYISRNLGVGEWVLDYSRTVKNTLSHELRQERIPIGAFIIGRDRETGKLFAHILPLPLSVLIYRCRKRLTYDLVKTVMGFDYQYWEYNGGLGRIRIHGDLVIDIYHSYNEFSPCQALTEYYMNEINSIISAMRRDLIYQRLNYRVLREVEEDHIIMRKNKGFTEYLAGVLTFASNYVIKDFLGKRYPDITLEVSVTPRSKYVDGKISFLKLTAYVKSADKSYPHHISRLENIARKVRNNNHEEGQYVDPGISFYNRIGELISIDSENVNLLVGSYIKGSLYSRIMQEYSLHELYIPFENVIIAIDVDDLIDFLDYYISKRLKDIIKTKLSWDICGEPSKPRHWGSTIFDGIINNTADLARYVLGLSKVTIDRHKIEVSAIDLSQSLTAKALGIREDFEAMIIIKKYLVGKNRTNTESFCTKKIIDAITRFFATKRGEVYALVESDIRFEHPEHGQKIFRIKHPTIIKFTLLNSMR